MAAEVPPPGEAERASSAERSREGLAGPDADEAAAAARPAASRAAATAAAPPAASPPSSASWAA